MISVLENKPRRNLAAELHRALVRILAPKARCALCNKLVGFDRLEIDHRDGRSWMPRELFRIDRVKRYWSEYLAGVRLRALCRSCNAIDGNHRRWDRERSAA